MLKYAPCSKRVRSTETPLSQGGRPALKIIGGPPSFWAQRTSPNFNKIQRSGSKATKSKSLAHFVRGFGLDKSHREFVTSPPRLVNTP
jgi:hypothetical protein